MALSFDANFLATGVAFAVLLIAIFFPALALGVRATLVIVRILFELTPMVFLLCGGGSGDELSTATGSLVVVTETCMVERRGKYVRLIKKA